MSRSPLILFAHPAFEKSRVNRAMIERASQLDGVTLHDLYERYPDLDIDVAREHDALLEHETIVMQHPFYRYSTPSCWMQELTQFDVGLRFWPWIEPKGCTRCAWSSDARDCAPI